jgi:2-polyprenyl-6-methoxyphenol hydroxylase-like FAD-dependent oxidoreductase
MPRTQSDRMPDKAARFALEDGLVLAYCLSARDNIVAAFDSYETSRRSRVDEIADMTRRRGATKQPKSRLGMFFRDLLVRIFVSFGNKSAERPLSFKVQN